ncbi:MAG: hypothetical protein WAM63_14085 [Rhodomicrobium sp.]
MSQTQQTPTQPRFETSTVMDMYMASVEAWKKNMDALAEASESQLKQRSLSSSPSADLEKTSVQLQKTGENIFRRAIEEQMELCRFFGKRWEQYLSLPANISRCRSPAEIAQLQLSFLTKMASDYGTEGRHFAQTFQELVSQAMAANPMPFAAIGSRSPGPRPLL